MRCHTRLVRVVVVVSMLGLLASCGGTSSMNSAMSAASGLYSALGSSGVAALANSFASKLAANTNVTKFLDTAAIDAAKNGLTNTLASLGGVKLPSGSIDLLGALSGKGLDAPAVEGVSQSLMDAGREQNLNAAQLSGLQAVMDPISKKLLGK